MSKRIVRFTAEIKLVPNKKQQGKNHGFQSARLVDADGGYEKFEVYFDPSKASFAREPGDYTIEASEPKIVDGRLVIFPDFVPAKPVARSQAA
ncbi:MULTISPECIES: hypothetical protein [Luteibacter]|uniref:hypothetical protein n=1 Tax=Luteibacter TaxID=242605 RepID=UPI00056D3BF6|nr:MULTISPECIES: hypothetical protein [unclassified Luteibacter]